jgi:hypothetical protein
MEWPGESVLKRLLDLFENAVGGALRPWQTRRVEGANTDARIRERLLLAQAELDIADLRAGRKKIDAAGKLITVENHQPLLLGGPAEVGTAGMDGAHIAQEFAMAAQDAGQSQAMQRAVNLKRIALFAEEDVEDIDRQTGPFESEGQPPRVDADWFTKWRNGAQDVSREEMQRLWAKLLAGEVAKPGTFSMHTVDFLSRMSSADADLLARAAPFVTSGGIVKLNDDFLTRHMVSFEDLLDLDDMGVINGTAGFGLSYTLGYENFAGRAISTLECNGSALVFDMGEIANAPPKLVFQVLTTTKVAREILSLASFPANEEYLQAIADMAIENGAHEVQHGTIHPNGQQIHGLRTVAKKGAEAPK